MQTVAAGAALNWVVEHLWATTEENLLTILAIAERSHDQVAGLLEVEAKQAAAAEAVLARGGNRLNGAKLTVVRDGVAVVPITGTISRYASMFSSISGGTNVEVLAGDLGLALADSNVNSILLHINSPGGEVTGINEFAQQVYQARKVKPVVAYVEGVGASAAYWIASATEAIYADATAMLGSIGVRGSKPYGDGKYTIISSQSPFKSLNPDNKLHMAMLQERIDQVAQVFINQVARNRNVTPALVLRNYGRGGVMVGQAAVEAGLADSLGSLEQVLGLMTNKRNAQAYLPPKRTKINYSSNRGATMSFFESLLGRKPTSEELAEANAELGIGVAKPTVTPPITGGLTGHIEADKLTGAEREELAQLRADSKANEQRVQNLLVTQAEQRGNLIARNLLKAEKITPAQEAAYAAAFGTLCTLEAMDGENTKLAWLVETDTGKQTMQSGIVDFFATAIENGAAHKLAGENATADLKVFLNQAVTKDHSVDQKATVDEERVARMTKVATNGMSVNGHK